MRAVHAAKQATGCYIFHCPASEALLHGETHGELSSVTAVHMPVLLLMSEALLVLSHGGTQPATLIPLAGMFQSYTVATLSYQLPCLCKQRMQMLPSLGLHQASLPLQVPS